MKKSKSTSNGFSPKNNRGTKKSTNESHLKGSKNYKKEYRGQGR